MALENWGYTQEEMKAAITSSRQPNRDTRICVCGHPARAHTEESDTDYHRALKASGRRACRPTRINCPCGKFDPVITATDVRKFSFKTDGIGPRHALAKGISAAIAAEVDLKWIEGVHCARCSRHDIVLYPVAIAYDRTESDRATPVNVMLCGDCRTGLQANAAETGEEV